jgi:hypothetical protein
VGSGRTIPIEREVLRELTLGQRALNIWVFIADITKEFILGLDILRLTTRQWTWDAIGYDRPG